MASLFEHGEKVTLKIKASKSGKLAPLNDKEFPDVNVDTTWLNFNRIALNKYKIILDAESVLVYKHSDRRKNSKNGHAPQEKIRLLLEKWNRGFVKGTKPGKQTTFVIFVSENKFEQQQLRQTAVRASVFPPDLAAVENGQAQNISQAGALTSISSAVDSEMEDQESLASIGNNEDIPKLPLSASAVVLKREPVSETEDDRDIENEFLETRVELAKASTVMISTADKEQATRAVKIEKNVKENNKKSNSRKRRVPEIEMKQPQVNVGGRKRRFASTDLGGGAKTSSDPNTEVNRSSGSSNATVTVGGRRIHSKSEQEQEQDNQSYTSVDDILEAQIPVHDQIDLKAQIIDRLSKRVSNNQLLLIREEMRATRENGKWLKFTSSGPKLGNMLMDLFFPN